MKKQRKIVFWAASLLLTGALAAGGTLAPVFSDEKNEKTTYVTLFGTDGAEQEVKRLTKEAVDELKNLSCPRDKIFLEELFESLTSRKK